MKYAAIWDGGYARDWSRIMRCKESARRLIVLMRRWSVWVKRT